MGVLSSDVSALKQTYYGQNIQKEPRVNSTLPKLTYKALKSKLANSFLKRRNYVLFEQDRKSVV